MDDLISRQAAMLAVSEVICRCEHEPCCSAAIVLSELPSAQRWIPVTERLPEANGRYLVTRRLKNACGSMCNRVYLINYSDLMGPKSERIWWNGNVGASDFGHINDVIAWMPLPEPWSNNVD